MATRILHEIKIFEQSWKSIPVKFGEIPPNNLDVFLLSGLNPYPTTIFVLEKSFMSASSSDDVFMEANNMNPDQTAPKGAV